MPSKRVPGTPKKGKTVWGDFFIHNFCFLRWQKAKHPSRRWPVLAGCDLGNDPARKLATRQHYEEMKRAGQTRTG